MISVSNENRERRAISNFMLLIDVSSCGSIHTTREADCSGQSVGRGETSSLQNLAQRILLRTRERSGVRTRRHGASRRAQSERSESREIGQKRGITPALSDGGRTR